jgi:hypothetical protein
MNMNLCLVMSLSFQANADSILPPVRADDSQVAMDEMEEIRVGVEMERQATEGFRFKGDRFETSPLSLVLIPCQNLPNPTTLREY